MASARSAPATARTGRSRIPEGQVEISRATWAGVALVIAAIVGAASLAVVSPSRGSPPPEEAPAVVSAPSLAPSASPLEGPVPQGQPTILDPVDGQTVHEWDLDIRVEVPAEELPRSQLILEIFVDGDSVLEVPRPETGEVAVSGVRLDGGMDTLTAALRGPGGLGPSSEPVEVLLDRELPGLDLTAPVDGLEVTSPSVDVVGVTEPAVRVRVKNVTSKLKREVTSDPIGAFGVPVPLEPGKNRLRVTVVDEAGGRQAATAVVERISAKPRIVLKGVPKKIKRKELPRDMTFRVVVRDGAGRPMEGAEVTFTMSSLSLPASSHEATTDGSGRATWPTQVPAAAGDTVSIGVDVTSPTAQSADRSMEIEIR